MFYRMLHFMSQKHFIFGLKGVIFMGTTQPIRNRQELQNFSSYYKQVKPHLRNYTLVVLGLNTALRISLFALPANAITEMKAVSRA